MNKIKPLMIKTIFSESAKSIEFPYVTELKYCQKLDFEASP